MPQAGCIQTFFSRDSAMMVQKKKLALSLKSEMEIIEFVVVYSLKKGVKI